MHAVANKIEKKNWLGGVIEHWEYVITLSFEKSSPKH